MRLGLNLAYSGPSAKDNVELVQFAESLGYDSVWTAEAYGSDAIVPLAWIGARTSTIKLGTAIMQMPGRTPAMTAMTAATLDAYSGGRLLLGLGLSGPQVVEGWHGQPYGKPLAKTREYVEIVRSVFAREAPLEHHGPHYDIPYRGPDATGLGKPLKSILHPRPDIPIYLAAIAPTRWRQVFGTAVGGRDLSTFDIAPTVAVVLGDDVDACRSMVKPTLALYVGGMGARGRNFYNDLACRYGFEAAAAEIQDLYLAGQKNEATAAVPDALVDAVALCGPKGRIAELVDEWKSAPVTTLVVTAVQREALELMAELVL